VRLISFAAPYFFLGHLNVRCSRVIWLQRPTSSSHGPRCPDTSSSRAAPSWRVSLRPGAHRLRFAPPFTVPPLSPLSLILTLNLTLPWWEATQLAGLVGGSKPSWVTQAVRSIVVVKGPAAQASRASSGDRAFALYLIVSVGGGMGERTFRGAIWARDHASPSNLAPWPSPAQRASSRVVSALRRRSRVERGRFRVVSTCRPGTLASAP